MASKAILTNLNLNKNELQNVVIQPLAAAPASPKLGQIYVNTGDNLLYIYNGTAWTAVGAVVSVNGKVGVVVLTQDDVGDGTTYKRTHNDLTDALVALINGALQKSGGTMSGAIAMGSNKITGLATGTADGDAVNLGQLNEAINQSSASFKGSFASKAALDAVAWQSTDPSQTSTYVTNNDYAYVADDETHDDEAWRYIFSKPTSAAGTWVAAYRINEAPLTQAQLDALNSGATAAKITQISTNEANIINTQEMVADVEPNSTAATAHAQGSLFVYNNVLYQATTSIIVGGTITPGTNCQVVTVDEILAVKAPLASPAFTGTPTAPTAAAGTNTTQVATTAFVQAALSGLIKTATGTIGTSATSATVSYSGTLINAYATMAGSEVVVDIAHGNGTVTFSTAQAPAAAITCVVVYA